MAQNYQEFVTTVSLNAKQAQDQLDKLTKKLETLKDKRDDLVRNNGSKQDVGAVEKAIRQTERSMNQLKKQARSVADVIDNMGAENLEELVRAQKMLTAEMKKTPQGTQGFEEISLKLQQLNTQIAAVRDSFRQQLQEERATSEAAAALQHALTDLNATPLNDLLAAEKELKRQLAEAAPDSVAFEDAAANLQKVRTRMREVSAAQKDVTATIEQYDAEIKNVVRDQALLQREQRLVNDTFKNLSSASVRDIEYSIKILNEELRKTNQGEDGFNDINEKLKKLKNQLRDINALQEDSKSWIEKTVDFFNVNWGALTQIGEIFSGTVDTIRGLVQQFADMQEAMADTRKYTGLTAEGVTELNEDLKKMDTRTPREKLNELAGAAGRLGITAKRDILEFVDAADKINVALGDDLGKGAIDQVGKLAMAFGEDDRMGLKAAMLATGSAINELAQNSAANAGYLVEFTARVAGVGKQLGMTQADIMGFGTVLDENLQKDEMAATAFSQLLTKMASDTAKFAKMANVPVKEFTSLVKNDMNGAVIALLKNLNNTGNFEQLAKMFGDMGLDGTRAIGVLSTLADKIDDIERHQTTANEAYKEGMSVISEFDTMNNTVQANIDKAKKRFQELSIELGQKLEPVAKHCISLTSMGVRLLGVAVNFISKNWKALVTLTASVVAYNIALKASTISQKLHNVATEVSIRLNKVAAGLNAARAAALTVLSTAYQALTGQITLATAAQRIWNGVIKANPYVAVATAVAALTAYLLSFVKTTKEATEAQKQLESAAKQAASETRSEVEEISALVETAQNKALADGQRKAAIEELQNKYPDYLNNLTLENINSKKARESVDRLTQSLLMQAKARVLVNKIREAEDKKQELNDDFFSGFSGFVQHMKAAVQAIPNMALDGVERLKNGVTGLLTRGNMTGFDEDTWITRNGYGTDEWQVWNKNYQNAVKEQTDVIAALRKELRATVEEQTKLKDFADDAKTDDGPTGLDYQSEADRKKAEAAERKAAAAARKQETERKKAQKQEIEDVKDAERRKLNELQQALVAGEMTLQEYLQRAQNIRVASLDEQADVVRKYHDDEANELSAIEQKKLSLQQRYAEQANRLTEEQQKHSVIMARMEVEHDYNDPTSAFFQNEAARNERLAEIDLQAQEQRLEAMKAQGLQGTLEYLQAENELREQKEETQLNRDIYFEQRRQEVRSQWLAMGNEEQQRIAINGLEQLHARQLLSEEEYQQARRAIVAQYAVNPTDKKNADFDKGVSDTVAVARSKASGGYDKTQGLSAANNPIVGQIAQYRSTMEQLDIMREQDKENHAMYEQAKREVTAQFLTDMVAQAQAAYDTVNQIMSAASTLYSAQQKLEETQITKKYDVMIEKAGSSTAKGKKLEEKKQKELAAIKSKYNKKQMTIEMAQAVASTALAAINAYASASKVNWLLGPIAAAAATAAGMLQIAAIKKQHQAEEAGYYEGGFTGGSSYRRKAGVVHEGEFVANHYAVENRNLLPALQLIDQAQRNNTVGSLTAADVSRALGQGGGTMVSAPTVNVQTDNSALEGTLEMVNDTVERLALKLDEGIDARVEIDGHNGLARQLERFNQRKNNV